MTNSAVPPCDKYSVGTLKYTKAGLFFLFTWMLWGDFCFTIMEMVFPRLMPLQLKEMGASDFAVGLCVGTIPALMNFFTTPVISFRSDRFRSRWGRRIPFLLLPTPFVALFLILLGFSPSISNVVNGWSIMERLGIAPTTVALIVIGLLIVGFQFFNMFVATVYYYLFNDVVPEQFLGRFIALFRAMGYAASFCFSFFIFGWAEHHMKEVFVGIAILYCVSFTLMCWKVKEGQYPPPPEMDRPGIAGQVRTYFRECFSHPFYRWYIGASVLWRVAIAGTIYIVFFAKDIGVNMSIYGKILGIASLTSAVIAYPIGGLIDRLRPPKVLLFSVFMILPCLMFFIFGVSGSITFAAGWIALQLAVTGYMLAEGPMSMAVLPKDRYGQFCSATAMIGAFVIICVTPLLGWLLDLLNNNYRYLFVWYAVFLCMANVCWWKVYCEWKKLGGPNNYVAPGFASQRG